MSIGDAFSTAESERYFDGCVKTLMRQQIERELNELSAKCDAETELAKKKQYTRRILELTVKLKNL